MEYESFCLATVTLSRHSLSHSRVFVHRGSARIVKELWRMWASCRECEREIGSEEEKESVCLCAKERKRKTRRIRGIC